MELLEDHPAIVIFDAFKGQKSAEIDELLQKNHLLPVPVPNNCTDQLQPIDLVVNKALKDQLPQRFTRWYAEQVQKQMENGVPVEEV